MISKKLKTFAGYLFVFTVMLVPVSLARCGVISDAPRVSELVFKILNFLLYLFGILAIIGLIVNGLRYVLAAGDERAAKKAKELIGYSIFGIVIVMTSMAVVKTISAIFG